VSDGWLDLAQHRPRDQPIPLELRDGDGDVVFAQLREVVQRLAVHVNHEAVTNGPHRIAVSVLKHPRRVDRDMALRVAEQRENIGRRCRDGAMGLDVLCHDSSQPPKVR